LITVSGVHKDARNPFKINTSRYEIIPERNMFLSGIMGPLSGVNLEWVSETLTEVVI